MKKPLLIKRSTRAFYQEGKRTPGYSFWDWVHGYVYGRWPYLYIGIGIGEHPLAKKLAWLKIFLRWVNPQPKRGSPQIGDNGRERVTFADTYHGKVTPLEAAKQLVTIHEEIKLPNLEKIIPYKKARDIVLKNPDHIVVMDCPCRSARENPCLPLDVCLVVGEPFASFVVEQHPTNARWITQQEAVDILEAEEQRGHVHHAFFKDAMLGRFYAICNCCAYCCGAMQAQRNGTPMLASSGYVCQVEAELCVLCGDCVDVCQFGALEMGDLHVLVDQDVCMGCGVCTSHCVQGALGLVRAVNKGEPLEIMDLIQKLG